MCKLGDFGLVFDLKRDSNIIAQDGDSKYLAQEVLNNPPGKPADIFSLGISMLELASDLDLPSRGEGWHMLREGHIPEEFTKDISPKLRRLIFLMMELNPEKRPTARELFHDSTIQYYLRKRYPLDYSMARFAKTTWDFIIYFLCLIFSPLLLPFKWAYAWLLSQEFLKTRYKMEKPFEHDWTPRFQRLKYFAMAPLNIDIGSDKDDVPDFNDLEIRRYSNASRWDYSETSNPRRENPRSPLMKKMSRCEDSVRNDNFCNDSPTHRSQMISGSRCSPSNREMTPEIVGRSSSIDDGDKFQRSDMTTISSCTTESINKVLGSSSPVSSRYVMQQDFARNVMSAPVRRPPFRFLRSGKLRSIPKLDFSLTDAEEGQTKEVNPVRPNAGREIVDRGSSADELEY